MKTRAVYLWLITAFVAIPVWAANHYVRADAAGNGSDWANAYGSLPAALTRGDNYYIADGSYGAYTFDDAGTAVITIKKATVADHGTETGWDNTYGDGQAVFNSTLYFKRPGNYVFDGQSRNENDWFDGAAYGFKVYHNNQDQNIVLGENSFSADNSADNVTIKYVYIEAIYQNLPGNTIRRYAIDTDLYEGNAVNTGLVFSRMYVYGANQHWFLRTTNGAIVEYSASKGCASNGANHGEAVNLYYSGNNAILRYNKFTQDAGTALVAITQANGLQFYGNVCWDYTVGDGAIGYDGGTASNCVIYNNTFVRGTGVGPFNSGGSNNRVFNNLIIGGSAGISGTHDYNAFSGSSSGGESHAQVNVPTSIFVNYAANDFRLAAATAAGSDLGATYNTDMAGKTRGADGVWDRGAYEYTVTGLRSADCGMRNETHGVRLPNPVRAAWLRGRKDLLVMNLAGEAVGHLRPLPLGIYLAQRTKGGAAQKLFVVK